MNTGNENPIVVDEVLSFSHHPTSSRLVFDSVKKIKYQFSPLNDSNCFGTLDYDDRPITNKDYSINHVFKILSNQELKKYIIFLK